MERFPAELGRFRIECELGRGGMGVVYRAFDPVVERSVAIKTIRYSDGFDGQFLERLRREAKAVGSLEHANIVTLFDAGDSDGVFYLVMQLVEGETLRQRMDRQHRFQSWEILDILRQLLAALEYAHARGIVHRDVKPENVLITPEGIVKLADFGVARIAGPGISTNSMGVGTPSYMAPEQILGSPIDGRSDIFSAGCILYEMVTGRKAFTGSSTTAVMYQILYEAPPMPGLVVPGIRSAIATAIAKSLAKDPAERFGSCAELMCALERCLAEELPPPVETWHEAAVPWLGIGARAARVFGLVKRRPAAAVATGIIVTLALLSPVLMEAPLRTSPGTVSLGRPPIHSELPHERHALPMQDAVPAFRRPPRPEERRPAVDVPLSTPNLPTPNLPTPNLSAPNLATPKPKVSPAEPDSFSSWMVRGDIAFQQDHYKEALQLYKKALQLRPADDIIRKKVAITLSLLGEPERARQYHR